MGKRKDWTPVEINVRFCRLASYGKSIIVHDDRHQVSRYTGKPIHTDNLILIKLIVGEGYDRNWARNLRGNTQLKLRIPRWLADEGRFNYVADNLQYQEPDARGSGLAGKDGLAGVGHRDDSTHHQSQETTAVRDDRVSVLGSAGRGDEIVRVPADSTEIVAGTRASARRIRFRGYARNQRESREEDIPERGV